MPEEVTLIEMGTSEKLQRTINFEDARDPILAALKHDSDIYNLAIIICPSCGRWRKVHYENNVTHIR